MKNEAPDAPVTVATFPSPHEAYLALAALESHGIDGIVSQDHVQYTSAGSWVFLQVARENVELAERVLETGPVPAEPSVPESKVVAESEDDMQRLRLQRRIRLARWFLYIGVLGILGRFILPGFFGLGFGIVVPLLYLVLAIASHLHPRGAFGVAFAVQSVVTVVSVALAGFVMLLQLVPLLAFYFAWKAATSSPPDELKSSMVQPGAGSVDIGDAWQRPPVQETVRRIRWLPILSIAAVGIVLLAALALIETPRFKRLIQGTSEFTLVGNAESAVVMELDLARARLAHELRAADVRFATIESRQPDAIEVIGVSGEAASAVNTAAAQLFPGWSLSTSPAGDVRVEITPSIREAIIDDALKATFAGLEKDFAAVASDVERSSAGVLTVSVRVPQGDARETMQPYFYSPAMLELREVRYPDNAHGDDPWPAHSPEYAAAMFGGRVPTGVELLVERHPALGARYWPVDAIPVVVGTDLVEASVVSGAFGDPSVAFLLTDEAGERLYAASGRLIGRKMAIALRTELGVQVLSGPTITARISTQGIIAGGYTQDEAESLAREMTAGSRPVRLSIPMADAEGGSR